MATRPIPSQEYLRECFDYDPETGALTWKHRPRERFQDDGHMKTWNTRYAGKAAGARSTASIIVGIDGELWIAARIIWRLVTGKQPDEVDHKDNDPFNNRWGNLREATSSQNKMNRRKHRGPLPKGVGYANGGPRFFAQISAGDIYEYLGTFSTAEEAHAAYCRAMERLHGEWANLRIHPHQKRMPPGASS